MRVLRVGDRVLYDGAEHQVVAISGSWVRLTAAGRPPSAALVTHLVASEGVEILGETMPARTGHGAGSDAGGCPARGCGPRPCMGAAHCRGDHRAASGRTARDGTAGGVRPSGPVRA